VPDIKEIESLIVKAEKKLTELDEQRERIQKELHELRHQQELMRNQMQANFVPTAYKPSVTNNKEVIRHLNPLLYTFIKPKIIVVYRPADKRSVSPSSHSLEIV